MTITATPGIAAAWSAAKAAPSQQAASQPKAGKAAEEISDPKKAPSAPEGQGTRVDVQV